MTQEEILRLISNNLKYSAYVYTQLNTVGNWNGDYKIEYLYGKGLRTTEEGKQAIVNLHVDGILKYMEKYW